MAASTMSPARHESDRKSTRAKKPGPERNIHHRVQKPLSRSALRHQNDAPGVPKLQTPSQHHAGDNALGVFKQLPYEVAEQIWLSVAASKPRDPSVNCHRFKWPEKWAENPGFNRSGPKDLLALMACSKAMHNDVFPILKRQMQGRTFNISLSESHGVQFESVRCSEPAPASKHGQASTSRANDTSVCQNIALSAFAKALPFIQYLNVTIELDYGHHHRAKLQNPLDRYISHTCSLLSDVDKHKLAKLNTNFRWHTDKICLERLEMGAGPNNGCRHCVFLRASSGKPAIWDAVHMARVITPLYGLARTHKFLGDCHYVTSSHHSCPEWFVRRAWDTLTEIYFRTLRGG